MQMKKLRIIIFLVVILLTHLANAESELTKDEVIAIATDYFESFDVVSEIEKNVNYLHEEDVICVGSYIMVSEEEKNAYHLHEEDVECIGRNMNGESIWYLPFFKDNYTDTSRYYDYFLILVNGTTGEIKLEVLPSLPLLKG